MEVIVVGSCMTDFVSYVPRLPKPGETLHGHRFAVNFGGKGANQCIVAARLGAKTAMVGMVGSDHFGKQYLENFRKNDVIDHVGQSELSATGVATISVDDSGQNSIVIVSGANLDLSSTDVDAAERFISTAKVLVCQLEIKIETTLHALRLAKKHGVTTIFNPAPAQDVLPDEIYELSDVFCPNETEAEILCGFVIQNVEDAKKAIQHFIKRGAKCVIITLGELGAIVGCHSDSDPSKYVHCTAEKVQVVDSTGAGDAFVGALAFFISQHQTSGTSIADTVKAYLQKSIRIATISVQTNGTQPSYPLRKDLPSDLFD